MSRKLDIHIMYSTERSVSVKKCVQEHRNLLALPPSVEPYVVQFYLRRLDDQTRTINLGEEPTCHS